MKVLVTGGCGYIGSHVVWSLKDAGRDVVVLDDLSTGSTENLPGKIDLIVGDVGKRALIRDVVRTHRVSAAIHLAGKILPNESLTQPTRYFWENTGKSLALVDALYDAGVHSFVFSSTAAVYDPASGPVVNEDSPVAPISPYGLSKLFVEQSLRAATTNTALRAVSLRYFNVAGADLALRCGPAGANPGHLIRTAVDVALGRKERLDIFGDNYDTPDGTCVRDYIHVSDLANAHLAALDLLERGAPFKVLNCGYGGGHSVLEVISALEGVIGRPLPKRVAARRAGDAPALVANASALRAHSTWTPRHADLQVILRSALAWAQK